MNIFLKMEGIPSKCVAFVVIMLATFTDCKFTTLSVVEGDVAFLNFTYSCSSTKVTLQRGNGAHIYNSRNPTLFPSSNLKLRNETDGETCFLYLTIDPVTRDDQGGFILFAYKNNPTQVEDDRIQLFVSYPPGKASCSLSEEYFDLDWVRLHCTAPIGTIGGFIMCYQHGIKIPPLNSPQQHDESLVQTLLAKLGDLVYCCSSTLVQTKDRCECKDSVWDPIQNKLVTNVSEPCTPIVTTAQYPPLSQQSIGNDEYELSTETLTGTPQQTNSRKALVGLIAIICLLIMVVVILSTVMVCYFVKHRKEKQSNFNRMNLKTPAKCEDENGVQESFISKAQV